MHIAATALAASNRDHDCIRDCNCILEPCPERSLGDLRKLKELALLALQEQSRQTRVSKFTSQLLQSEPDQQRVDLVILFLGQHTMLFIS